MYLSDPLYFSTWKCWKIHDILHRYGRLFTPGLMCIWNFENPRSLKCSALPWPWRGSLGPCPTTGRPVFVPIALIGGDCLTPKCWRWALCVEIQGHYAPATGRHYSPTEGGGLFSWSLIKRVWKHPETPLSPLHPKFLVLGNQPNLFPYPGFFN